MRLRDWWGDQSANHRAAYISGTLAVLAAIIAGTSAVTAAIINAEASARNPPYVSPSPASPTHRPAPTATNPNPSPQSTPSQTAKQPSPEPTTTTPVIPLLRPIINQSGWTLAWHQHVLIGPQGIIFGFSGPQASDGSNYDLQYVPGSDNGWGYGGFVDAFNPWSYNYSPGPATINGISGTSTGSDVAGMEAHVGDRLYVTRSTAFRVDRIAYMQIVGVGRGGVVADIWTWNAS
jgi:hypothetical protein